MNHLFNITKKELKELLTPSSIMSVLVVVIIFAALGSLMTSETEKAMSPSAMLIVDGDTYDDTAVDLIKEIYCQMYLLDTSEVDEFVTVIAGPLSDSDTIDKMLDVGAGSAIIIGPGFQSKISAREPCDIKSMFIYNSSGMMGNVSGEIAMSVLTSMNNYLLATEGGTTTPWIPIPSNVKTYINGGFADGTTPSTIDSALMSQNMAIPLIIMIIIVMIGSIVISSMGNEKENKTLETLLTMPVKRTTIVTGKLLAAGITGLVFGGAYMGGMMTYVGGMTKSISGGVDLSGIGLTLGPVEWALVLIQMFLAIMCALGICMVLGAFAKNFKSAQTMALPVSVLAMIPMFVLMFLGWNPLPTVFKGVLFAIPFTHPMMAMNNLMFGNTTLVYGGIVYLALFTLAIIFIVVRLYKSDILITGLSQNAYVVKMKKLLMKKA